MRMHFTEAITYCRDNKNQLAFLSEHHSLIICPSFIALNECICLFKGTQIKIGAQDCSAFKDGSHTGEISAQSLQEINCSYCIVGHSERRIQFNETNETIADKVVRLLENNIIPIVCIGENKPNDINSIYSVLEEQLCPIFLSLNSQYSKKTHLIFAYEPMWAINNHIIPEEKYLEDIFVWLQKTISTHIPFCSFELLYGGGINKTTIKQLKEISYLNGFLIGKASTEFKELKAIIESTQD
jgi:triosephosphate isomerase (TIM)